jgi:hypothetical protein
MKSATRIDLNLLSSDSDDAKWNVSTFCDDDKIVIEIKWFNLINRIICNVR